MLTPFRSSGVAAIWTFWVYPGTAESEGAANVGLKQYIAKTILNFQNILGAKFFAFFLIFVSLILIVFLRNSVERIGLKHTITAH